MEAIKEKMAAIEKTTTRESFMEKVNNITVPSKSKELGFETKEYCKDAEVLRSVAKKCYDEKLVAIEKQLKDFDASLLKKQKADEKNARKVNESEPGSLLQLAIRKEIESRLTKGEGADMPVDVPERDRLLKEKSDLEKLKKDKLEAEAMLQSLKQSFSKNGQSPKGAWGQNGKGKSKGKGKQNDNGKNNLKDDKGKGKGKGKSEPHKQQKGYGKGGKGGKTGGKSRK